MTTTHELSPTRTAAAPAAVVPTPPGHRRPGLLALAAVAVLAAVGVATLGPAGYVADARLAVMAAVEALTAPWPGTVHRAHVEAAANVLLFVPVGALAARVLRRSGPALPAAVGAALSLLVELAQAFLPGRVPDLVDVATNTTGTVVGVALTGVSLAVSRRVRRGGARRPRRGLLPALVTAPLLVAGVAGCSTAGPGPGSSAGAVGAPVPSAWDGSAETVENGYVADGEELSAFDDVPAITGLDPALRSAVQAAERDATAEGRPFHVSSGWRSAAYQQELFDAAVQEHGSPEAARQWVLGPEESSHVTGDAVDIGPTDAMYWLAQHGSDHGLCQTYANEVWHYQLTVEPGGECPAPSADPTAGRARVDHRRAGQCRRGPPAGPGGPRAAPDPVWSGRPCTSATATRGGAACRRCRPAVSAGRWPGSGRSRPDPAAGVGARDDAATPAAPDPGGLPRMPVLAIIGAGRGLGAAVARRFGAEGFDVALIARNQTRVSELAADLATEGITAGGFVADVRDPASVTHTLAQVAETMGTVEVLQYSPLPDKTFLRPVLETTAADLVGPIEFSVYGPVAAVRQVLPGMRYLPAGSSPSILFVNGGSAVVPDTGVAGTSIAFAGLSAYAQLLNEVLTPEGIQVSQLVIPGKIVDGDPVKGPDAMAGHLWDLHTRRDRFRHQVAGQD